MTSVQYKRNPLITVVCQVRFPPILTISEAVPAAFQEELGRNQYPKFDSLTKQHFQFNFEQDQSGTFSIPAIDQTDSSKIYRFASEDATWMVDLTNTSLAVTTSCYSSWEEFGGRFGEIITKFQQIYSPVFFERVGLRYINAIQRTKLGLSLDTQWAELIRPFALGFLSDEPLRDKTSGYSSIAEVKSDNGVTTRVITALGQVKNGEQVQQHASEVSFIIDTDSFVGKTSICDCLNTLMSLHQVATDTFQSIITEKLHEVMEPIQK